MEMGLDEARSRQKRAQIILGMPLEDATEARLKETYANLSKQWPKVKFLNPKGVPEGDQIESIYLQYSQLSADAAHPSLTALCRYLLHEEGTRMRGIDMCPLPRSGEMASTVHIACIALIGACVAAAAGSGDAVKRICPALDAMGQRTFVIGNARAGQPVEADRQFPHRRRRICI
jgi:hypothetical protein